MKYGKIPILLYHDISEVDNPWCVSPVHFEAQIGFLVKNGYQTITLDALQEGMVEDKEVKGKFVAITFDDARTGVYHHAFPLLKKYGFTAAVFVVPAWIDGQDIPTIERYSGFMSWKELQEMHAAGFDIGSHSYSHKNLLKLSGAEQQQELRLAEEALYKNIGVTARHSAYPFGKWNEKLAKELQKRYTTVLSMERGFSKMPGAFSRQTVLRKTSLEEFSSLLVPPRLSLCMIAKNEEAYLANSLMSVKELVDETIFVDTGSTDKTKEIAQKFTDTIFDFPWQDDFAAAKNESIRHATGDWILILDADEVLAKEDHTTIREIIEAAPPSVLACKFVLRNYTPDSRAAGWKSGKNDAYKESSLAPGWWEVSKIRLFRNRKGLHFQGRIHETITESLPEGAKVMEATIPIHHYGKLLDAKHQERALYKEKLYERLERHKAREQDDFYAYFELGRQLVQNKKLQEAVTAFQESIKRKEDYFESWFMLGSSYLLQGEYEKAQRALEKARSLQPRFAPVYANLGVVYAQRKQFEEAISAFRQALSLNERDAASWKNLATCFQQLGKAEEAKQALSEAQELNPAYN